MHASCPALRRHFVFWILTDTTKYDDIRNAKELCSTTVSGLAPLKDQGFYLPSTEGRIVLKGTDETFIYRRVWSRRWLTGLKCIELTVQTIGTWWHTSRDEPGVYILLNYSNRNGSGSGSCKIGISHVSRKTSTSHVSWKTGTSHVPLPLPSVGCCPHRRSQTSILYPIFSFLCLFHFYSSNDCRFNNSHSYLFYP